MLEKIKALMSLFKQGQAVADPAKWKARQVTVTMLAGVIIAIVQLARAFGHEIPIDTDTATALAGGAIAVVNTVLTITTSKTVGVRQDAVREAQPSMPSNAEAAGASADGQVANEQDVPSGSQAPVEQSSIDDDVRKRAEAWVREHSVVQRTNADNVLKSDA